MELNENAVQTIEQQKKNINDSKKSTALIWIFLEMLSLFYLPFALKALSVVINQRPISSWLCVFYQIVGVAMAVAFGFLSVKNASVEEKKTYLQSGLYFLAACLFANAYLNMISELLLSRMLNKMYLYFFLLLAVMAIVALLFALAIPFKGAFLKNVGRCFLALFIYESAVAVFDLILQAVSKSFATISVFYLSVSLLAAFLICFCIEKNYNSEKKKASFWECLAPAVVIMGSLVVTVLLSLPTSPEDAIANNLYASMETATMELFAGNTDLAFLSFKNGAERREEWYALLSGEEEKIQPLEESDFMQIKYLALERNGNVEAIEDNLLNGNYSLDVGKEYLRMLSKEKDRTEDAMVKDLKNKIVKDMVVNDSFASDVFSYQDMIKKSSKIMEELDKFSDFDKYKKLVGIVKKKEDGSLELSDVRELLNLADEYEEDIYIQYIAASYGVFFPQDSNSMYWDIVHALYRYKDLYEEYYGKNKNVTYDVLNKLYAINQYAEIIKLIEEENDPDELELQYKAACYIELREFDLCEETVNEILKQNPEDYNAKYYLFLLKEYKSDYLGSLSYARTLAEQIETLDGLDKEIADAELYIIVQHYTAKDVVDMSVFHELSKEEEAFLQSNEVLYNYYYASYYCYTEPDAKLALTYIQKLKEAGYETSNVFYLEGNINMEEEDFANAVIAYKKSLELMESPTVWYALANAYDALGDYDYAYQASLKAGENYTTSDHDKDKYGVALHNKILLEGLQKKLREE